MPPPLNIVLAYVFDLLFGDPEVRWHPVRLIGDLAQMAERLFFRWGRWGGLWALLWTSALFTGVVGGLVWLLPPLEAVFLYFFIASRALAEAAERVGEALRAGDLPRARRLLSFIVGRQTKDLSPSECVRAAVETVAENFTDAFVGPLFWYLVGGLPLAAAYKCVETLDSMFGYRTERYRAFGFFPAKTDDLLNFIPARLAGLFLSIGSLVTGLSWRRALITMWRDAKNHDSPNSGFTEAAMAGALGIELGGPVIYQGRRFEKGRFGKPLREREVEDIFRATKLLKRAALLWVLFILVWEVILWKSGYPHLIALITNGLKGV